jgi:hypothetical protein
MAAHICEDCGHLRAHIGDVVTGAELLGALSERAAQDNLQIDEHSSAGECLVYMMFCESCDWQSIRSTERINPLEDPEPIG